MVKVYPTQRFRESSGRKGYIWQVEIDLEPILAEIDQRFNDRWSDITTLISYFEGCFKCHIKNQSQNNHNQAYIRKNYQ